MTASKQCGALVLALAAVLVAFCVVAVPRAAPAPVTVYAAGDIAFCERGLGRRLLDWWHGYSGEPGAPATAALLDERDGPVLVLGDLAYWEGTAEEFRDCYDRSWGRHKARSYPVPGNHEYRSDGAGPYFDYWGDRAGPPGRGYYSFDFGAWHVVALNSNIDVAAGSEQEAWLRRDLALTEARCILAYWHHPRFSSGRHRDQPQMTALYAALYDAGVSLLLAGHDHHYERFAPLDPAGRLDPKRGLRNFVVGTGGGQLKPSTAMEPPRAHSEALETETWGLLELTLHADGYEWRFLPVAGGSFTDRGAADCVQRDAIPPAANSG